MNESHRAQGVALRGARNVALMVCAAAMGACGDTGAGAGPDSMVAAVQVEPASFDLEVGATVQLVAMVQSASGAPLNDEPLVWTSSDQAIVTITTNGVATGRGEGSAQVTATAGGMSGSAAATVIPESVSTITLDRPNLLLSQGGQVQLVATLRGASGSALAREVTWTSNGPAVATVTASGMVSGVVLGGPITVTAEADGQSATTQVTVTDGLATGIVDIHAFLDTCPNTDAAFSQITGEFELLSDGTPLAANLACTEPFSTQPIHQLTDELIAYQVLRVVYYMSFGTEGALPWSPGSLYSWMNGRVSGFNLKTAPGQLYCCDVIAGKQYVSVSRQSEPVRETKRKWAGLASTLAFYAHEVRHADPGTPSHVNGCQSFPDPTDPVGCDPSYDITNLGSYGVQYWLQSQWASGFLNVGLGCTRTSARVEAQGHASAANQFRSRFVAGVPPTVTAGRPYGGRCLDPS